MKLFRMTIKFKYSKESYTLYVRAVDKEKALELTNTHLQRDFFCTKVAYLGDENGCFYRKSKQS